MKKRDLRLLAEALFFKKEQTPPARKREKLKHPERSLSVEEFIEILDKMPELRRKLEEAFKKNEPHKKDEKKKDHLSHGQKYLLTAIASVTLALGYGMVFKSLF
jgi:hypothetical protein